MDQISPLAWVAIVAIILITVAVNIFMVSLLRGRSKLDEIGRRLQSRGPSRTARTIQNMREITRDPFQKDRKQLDELSKLVARIPKKPGSEDPKSGTRPK